VRAVRYSELYASIASTSQLIEDPVFRHSPWWMLDTPITQTRQNEVLAYGIPALSGAIGGRAIRIQEGDIENLDMNAIHRPNQWPRTSSPFPGRWLHSDIKNIVYFYNFTVFEDIVEKGGLK